MMQTRSTVLGKRHALLEARSSSSSSMTASSLDDEEFLPTPGSTPNPKRIRTSVTVLDGDNNKENVAPLRVEPINTLAPTPRAVRTLRRNSTEHIPTSRSGSSLRRHASLSQLPPTTPATRPTHLSLSTPPPSPPSVLRPIHSRVRAFLRPTCNGFTRMAGRESEKTVISEFISASLSADSSTASPSILYISGSPGTGKTALVNVLLGDMRDELGDAQVSVVTVNCMALNSVDALLERLVEEFRSSEKMPKKAGRGRKVKETTMQILDNLFSQTTRRCMLLLDELDHIASSTSSLTTLFTLIHSHAPKLRAIGIANTHTLSSTTAATSISAFTLTGVRTMHFAPYTPQQLFEIVQTRLAPLKDSEAPERLDTEIAKFLPTATLTLLTKKVAAMTGDVRAVLEVLRGAIDIAVNTSASADATGNPLNTSAPAVSPAHVLSALKAYTPASSARRPAPAYTAGAGAASKATDSEIIAKIRELGLQSRLALLSLLLARTRLDSQLPLSGSSATCPTPPTTPRSPAKRSRSSVSLLTSVSGVDVDALYVYYKSVLARVDDGVFAPVSRSEFSDLLGMLETVGLIHLSLSSSSPGTPSKSAKRGLARTTSFSAGASKGGQEIKLVEGVRVEEVCRGLGIDDGQDVSDVRTEEVRAVWRKEKARIAREAKARSRFTLNSDTFDEAVED